MAFVRRCLALAAVLACLYALFRFRSIPATRIWKDYSVLYVERTVEESRVLALLAEAGCEDVISLSAQRLPFSSQFIYPQPDGGSYLERRLAYFTDGDFLYNLFYIHERYGKQARAALGSIVRETHCRAGMDAGRGFPFLAPLVCAAVFCFLSVAAAKKRYFVLPAVFPVLFALSRPDYTVAAASCLLQAAIFLTNRLWLRRNDILQVLKNVYIVTLLAAFLAICAVQSPQDGGLALLVLAAAAAALLLVRGLALRRAISGTFSYSLIFSASQVSVAQKRNMRCLLLLLLPLSVLLVLFLSSADFFFHTPVAQLALPCPVPSAEGEDALPVMDDYFVWAWFTLTFPYRSLYEAVPETVREGDQVGITGYRESGNVIDESLNTVYTYDSDFKAQLAAYMAEAAYPAIEKLLERQDWNQAVAYARPSRGGRPADGGRSLILLLVALGMPLLLCVCYACFGRVKI